MSDDPIMGNDEFKKAQEVAFNQVVSSLKSPVSEEMIRNLVGGLGHLAEHDTERVLDALRDLPNAPTAKHLDHARDLVQVANALGHIIDNPSLLAHSNALLTNFSDMAARAIVDLARANQGAEEEKQPMRELLRLTQDSIVALHSRFSHISERMEDME